MTSKEFMRKNPFDCKFLIGPQSRCKQEIKWVCEDGQTVINTHCMTVEALADMINGYVENEKLNELLKAMVYLDLLEQNEPNLKYFKGESRRVMGTAKQLVKVIDMLRLEGGYEELKNQKDDKLFDIYTLAKAYEEGGYYDRVQAILDAIENTSEWAKNQSQNISIGVFEYDRLSAKEVELLELVAKEFGSVVEKLEYGDVIAEATDAKCGPEQFFKVYGNNNEIKAVVKDIIKRRKAGEDISFDKVQIIACNDACFIGMQTFLESLDIAYYMPEGISGKYSFEYSKAAQFLKERNNLCFEKTSLSSICDEIIEQYKNRKIYNVLVAEVKNIKKNLPKEICGRYEDMSNLLLSMLETIRIKGKDNAEGALYITTLSSTECVLRKYVYMIGFSSSNYNSNSPQLAVLLDDEILALSEGYKKYTVAAGDRFDREKIDRILFSNKAHVTLSYNCFDTVNMREQNPAGFYVKCINLAGKDINNLPVIGYEASGKDDVLTKAEFYLLENANISTIEEENYEKYEAYSGTLKPTNKGFSASAMDSFVACPYQFLYKYRSGIKDDERQKPTETKWLDALGTGNLTHNILEEYVYTKIIEPISGIQRVSSDESSHDKGGTSYEALEKMVKTIDADKNILKAYNSIDEDVFEKIVKEEAQKIAKERPYISEISYNTEVEEIRTACEEEIKNIYKHMADLDKPRVPVAVEFKFEQLDLGNGNVVNEGYIDRIDYCLGKGFVIVDYKSSSQTGYEAKKEFHENVLEDRFQTVQDLVYLLALENGFPGLKDKVYLAEYIFTQIGENFVSEIWKESHTDVVNFANKVVTSLLEKMRETDISKLQRNLPEGTCTYCVCKSICDVCMPTKKGEEY